MRVLADAGEEVQIDNAQLALRIRQLLSGLQIHVSSGE